MFQCAPAQNVSRDAEPIITGARPHVIMNLRRHGTYMYCSGTNVGVCMLPETNVSVCGRPHTNVSEQKFRQNVAVCTLYQRHETLVLGRMHTGTFVPKHVSGLVHTETFW